MPVRACCWFLLFILMPGLAAGGTVVASIEPLAMTAREVLGPDARVETLLKPGQNLHGASLSPDQARRLRTAELVIWLGPAAEPGLAPLIEQRPGPDLALLSLEGVHRLYGGHGHEEDRHRDKALDPHLWLDPRNMERLGMALAARRGRDGEKFRARLTETRRSVAQWLAPVRDRGYVSHHDPWAYFARAFSLGPALVASDAVTAGVSARALVGLARRMDERGIQCVLAEPDARRALLERLCDDDCRLVAVDPMGRAMTEAGYTDFLTHLGRTFRHCLGGEEKAGDAPW